MNRRDTAKLLINRCTTLIEYRVMGLESTLDLVITACDTDHSIFSETTTTGTTAADATFPPLSTNKFAIVIMKKKKRKERNE